MTQFRTFVRHQHFDYNYNIHSLILLSETESETFDRVI